MRGTWRSRRGGPALLVCALALLAPAANASAAGEYEQNDSRETAYGPLVGGTDYTATFETDNDVDWYVFYIKTYSQMDFSATSIGDSCAGNWAEIDLLDKDGKFVDDLEPGELNVTNHLRLTLGPGRYYFEVDSYNTYCTGRGYRFRIDPAASITPSRDCGEAIVAREGAGPELAALSAKVAKNGEALAKAEGLMAARKAAFTKLKLRKRAPRWKKRQAREKLLAAKGAREEVEVARAGLLALGAQYNAALGQAQAQIAASC